MKKLQYERGADGYIPLPEKRKHEASIPSSSRKASGRPRLFREKMQKRVLFSLPRQIADEARKAAYDSGLTMSDFVREALFGFTQMPHERRTRQLIHMEQGSALVPDELYDLIETESKASGVTASAYVRQAILAKMRGEI